MNNYLIPANTKKGLLLFSIFRPFDLILFLSGISVSLILLLTMQLTSLQGALISLAPALICGFLVIPIPNYHNVLCVFVDIYNFLSNQRKYEWKGWCFIVETSKNKK